VVNILWYQDLEHNQDSRCERDVLLELKSERQRILVDDKTVVVGISMVASGRLLLLETNLIWNILPALGFFHFLSWMCTMFARSHCDLIQS
jgi:hypothetical protein